MSEVLGVPVTPVGRPEDAIDGVDIAMCGSNSNDPIFFERWVKPGMHLTSIKTSEIEPTAIQSADRVAVHTHDAAPILVVAKGAESEAIRHARGWNTSKELDFGAFPKLPDLISGRVRGREDDGEVTCFLNNLGLGYQFAAAGSIIYQRAVEQGRGRNLPTDWFTETEHS